MTDEEQLAFALQMSMARMLQTLNYMYLVLKFLYQQKVS